MFRADAFMKAALFLVMAVGAPMHAARAEPVPRFDAAIRGWIAATGNTLGLAGRDGSGGSTAGPSANDGIGVFTDASGSLQVAGWPAGTTTDWTLASSAGWLDLPAGAAIAHAELVWAGSVDAEVLGLTGNSIRLTTPSGAEWEVAPTTDALDGVMSGGAYYARTADVTALVEGGGRYVVGGVPASLAGGDAAAGWALHVVHTSPDAAPARVSLHAFGALVDTAIPPTDTTIGIGGLCMPADAGTRSAAVHVSALDGDASISGDTLRFAGSDNGLNDGSRLAAPGRALNNALGGFVTGNDGAIDTRGTFGNLNHAASAETAGARQGWDLSQLDASAMLTGNQRQAWFRASATGDVFGLVAVAMASTLRTPVLITESAETPVLSASATTGAVGEAIDFEVRVANVGDAGAGSVVFTLPGPLPAWLAYVDNSFAVDGGPVLGGPVRDAAELHAGVGLNNIPAGETVVVTLTLQITAVPDVASWAFAPVVTYVNQVCSDAPILGDFAPEALILTFGITPVDCGDGVRDAGVETCDDGNTDSGDGCSALCQTERGWTCDDVGVCAPVACGDGIRAVPAEGCDDGNTNDGDGCAADCTIDVGFDCTHLDAGAGPDSTCLAVCGDGRRARWLEACDDGNTAAGDGCDASCGVEPGWTCDADDGATSVCAAICGDGLVVGGEACDDGGTTSGDGCAGDCAAVEHGWYCTGAPSDCETRCGDGLIGAGAESCDDGNGDGGDGCDAACVVESGWSCGDPPAEPSLCASNCGDGLVRGVEACDDGNDRDGDGCTSDCRLEDGWTCPEGEINVSTTCLVDTDDDGIADDGDGSGVAGDNPCAEGVTESCDDNCPGYWNPDQTFPADGDDTALCGGYRGPRIQGGGGGCATGNGGLAGALFAIGAFFLARRKRRAVALLAIAVVGHGARAQSVDPRLFDPALSPLGILGVETTATHRHLHPFGGLLVSVANDELVTQVGTTELERGPLRNRTSLLASAGLGLGDVVDVAVWMPLHWTASGGGNPAAFGAGDLRLGAIWRVSGPAWAKGRGFGLALAVDATVPTGAGDPFMSDGGLTFMPRLVLDFRDGQGAALALRLGARLRPATIVDDLEIHHELTFGVGAELPLGGYGFSLLAELDGRVGLGDSPVDGSGVAERQIGVEMRGGARWRSDFGLVVTLAGGSGVSGGYGAPDYRAIIGLAYTGQVPTVEPEPLVTVSEGGVLPEQEDTPGKADGTSGNAGRARGPTLPSSDFDRMVLNDPDRDADGIVNDQDKCPDQAEDLDAFEDTDGCPDLDNDGDGLADADDKCPLEKEVYNGVDDDDGCPDEGESTVKMVGSQLQIPDRIRFRSGSAELLPSDQLILDEVARAMKAHATVARFRIEGHTDNQGDREFNVDLAERRAWAVRAYIIEQGVSGEKLFPKGYGSTRAIASNGTEKGRALNRRVEFHVVAPGERMEGGEP